MLGSFVPKHLFREFITFQKKSITKDTSGFSVITFSMLLSYVLAAVQEKSGSEYNHVGKEMSNKQYKIYVSSKDIDEISSQVVEQTRIKWVQNGVTRYLGITNVRDYDSQRRITELSCEELNVGDAQI